MPASCCGAPNAADCELLEELTQPANKTPPARVTRVPRICDPILVASFHQSSRGHGVSDRSPGRGNSDGGTLLNTPRGRVTTKFWASTSPTRLAASSRPRLRFGGRCFRSCASVARRWTFPSSSSLSAQYRAFRPKSPAKDPAVIWNQAPASLSRSMAA